MEKAGKRKEIRRGRKEGKEGKTEMERKRRSREIKKEEGKIGKCEWRRKGGRVEKWQEVREGK